MPILRMLMVSLLVLFSSCVSASSAGQERWLASQLARVVVAADGTVQEAALERSKLSPAMQESILKQVRAFEFEPATKNGVAAITETYLSVKLAVEPDDEKLLLRVIGADITFKFVSMKPPRFSPTQLRRGKEGRVVVRVAYDADGKVNDVVVEESEPENKTFRDAVVKAAQDWQLQPERVAGQGIAGSALIPVTFEIGDKADSGEISFPDGGKLQVVRKLQPADQLLSSTLRLRATQS